MRLLFLALLCFAMPTVALAGANPGGFMGDGDPTKMSMLGFILLVFYAGVLPLLMLSVAFGRRRVFGAAFALLFGLTVSGCVSQDGKAWGQFATATGALIGETRIDPQIERISAKLARYCTEAQTAALAVDLFAPEKVQKAATEAKIVVATYCAAPPSNLATAITAVFNAYAAVLNARKTA